MPSLGELFQNLWASIQKSPTNLPTEAIIPADHISPTSAVITPFKANEHYFQVRINELFLTYARQWTTTFDPMVFVVTEFTYNNDNQVVPFVVGPSLLEQFAKQVKVPQGMIFADTRVAGIHPYRGGRLALSVILCRVARTSYAQNLLQLIESTAGALDFSTALGSYLKIAHVVLDGINTMFGLDPNSVTPQVGYRKEFDSNTLEGVNPSYFALINSSNTSFDQKQLWVHEDQLLYGPSLDQAQPFRQADYVLYSLVQCSQRDDITTLPFYPLHDQMLKDAMEPDDTSWTKARSEMVTLYSNMALSPDLILQQANDLTKQFSAEMIQGHTQAVSLSSLSLGNITATHDAKPTMPESASFGIGSIESSHEAVAPKEDPALKGLLKELNF